MGKPEYDRELDHFVVDARHRWLVIKKRDGPLSRRDAQELASYEAEIAAYA